MRQIKKKISRYNYNGWTVCYYNASYWKKNEYLLYDVINSILKKSNKPINLKNPKTNYKKIKKKLSRYMNYINELKYKRSFYGNRPIPIKDNTADRSTKIIKEKLKNKINFISIREGKYISAPYIAKEIS